MAAHVGLLLIAVVLIAGVLWDTFETIILPRRVTGRFRLPRLFYRTTWVPWSALARRVPAGKRRESFLSFFGPLSLLLLFGAWAVSLILGFALLHWALGLSINVPNETVSFSTDLYLSGTTFFTLGLGDVTPRGDIARAVTVIESGVGFGFLAIVIAYLPVLYGAFSRREVNISRMDARAGSPSTASELLRRHIQGQNVYALGQYLHDWESWAAELMESHLSYPVLCYFRSQHTNQSWLAALGTILDACALVIAYAEKGGVRWQAKMTFAISCHAAVDLAEVLGALPRARKIDRLTVDDLGKLRTLLTATGIALRRSVVADQKLEHLRQMYEPYIKALSDRLLMPLPPWTLANPMDNWAWTRASGTSPRHHSANDD
jgi:Ion channel